jgi:hypothetical protein
MEASAVFPSVGREAQAHISSDEAPWYDSNFLETHLARR